MTTPQMQRKMETRKHGQHQIRCNQVNLQHSRAATDNLMQIISTDRIGIALIQEPYLYQNRPLEIPKDTERLPLEMGKAGLQL